MFDRDAAKAAELFPAQRVVMLEDVGLPETATDSEIVRAACDRKFIVVTCNGDDFVREFNSYLAQTKKLECHDMYGLVVLPNGFEIQRRVVPKLVGRLRLEGNRISWREVWEKDCLVKIGRNGAVATSRFPRCHYCKKSGLD
ncbi:MAG: hypothetical protein ABSC64_14135 [Candidatus Korobacteraceae bacterium]